MCCSFGGQPEWAISSESFPVGCRFSTSITCSHFFSVNPDRRRRLYSSAIGIYQPNCGLAALYMSWSAYEYLYLVLLKNKTALPPVARVSFADSQCAPSILSFILSLFNLTLLCTVLEAQRAVLRKQATLMHCMLFVHALTHALTYSARQCISALPVTRQQPVSFLASHASILCVGLLFLHPFLCHVHLPTFWLHTVHNQWQV